MLSLASFYIWMLASWIWFRNVDGQGFKPTISFELSWRVFQTGLILAISLEPANQKMFGVSSQDKGLKNYGMINFSYAVLEYKSLNKHSLGPKTRWVQSTFSSHCLLSSGQPHLLTAATSIIFSSEFFLVMLGIKLGAAGWEANILPLCYAAPFIGNVTHKF